MLCERGSTHGHTADGLTAATQRQCDTDITGQDTRPSSPLSFLSFLFSLSLPPSPSGRALSEEGDEVLASGGLCCIGSLPHMGISLHGND